MKFLWRTFVSLVLLAFIFVNVYVACLPSDNDIKHAVVLPNTSSEALLQNISTFDNWKSANFTPQVIVKVKLDAYEPLHNKVTVNFKNSDDELSVQNQVLNDTLVVQHVYGLDGNKATIMQWLVKKAQLRLEIKQEITTLQKLKKLFGFKDVKNTFLKHNYTQLIPSIKVGLPKEVPVRVEKQEQTPLNTIRLPKQN